MIKKLSFFLGIILVNLILINSQGLDIINNNSATVCWTNSYDYVNITNSTVNICKVFSGLFGYWNVTASTYFYMDNRSIINGTGAGANAGLGGQAGYNGNGGGGCTGLSGNGGNTGGVGGGGGGSGSGCVGGSGGSGGTGSAIISNSTSRYGINYGSGAGGGGGGGSASGNGAGSGEEYTGGSCGGVITTFDRNGGGALRIAAQTINIFGKIYVDGLRGGNGGNAQQICQQYGGCFYSPGGGGGGGGGSAGMISIDGVDVNVSGASFIGTGGSGGTGGVSGGGCEHGQDGADGGQGQGGAGGILKIFYKNLFNSSTIINLAGGTGSSAGTTGIVYYERPATTISVILESPIDSYTSSSSIINYICNATILQGFSDVNLTNISLWSSLYGWKINQTNSISGLFNQTNFSQFIFKNVNWSCQACSNDGLCYFSQNRSIFYTFYPQINLNLSSVGLNLSINISNSFDPNNLSYCYYNITRGDGIERGNTVIPNCSFANYTLSTDSATYTINVWVNNSLNTANTTYQTFSISSNGTIIIIINQINIGGGGGALEESLSKEFFILNSNLVNTIDVSLAKSSKKPREKQIVFLNKGKKELTLKLSCNVIGANESSRNISICDYVKFLNETIIVSPNEDQPTQSSFLLYTPDGSDFNEEYYFNIVAKDDDSNTYAKLSVSSSVSLLSTIFYKNSYFSDFPLGDTPIDFNNEKTTYPVFLLAIIFSAFILLVLMTIFIKFDLILTGLIISLILSLSSGILIVLFV